MYVSYQQDDWVEWLPLAEFCVNNSTSDTTQASLYPRLGFEPQPPPTNVEMRSSEEFVKHMEELESTLRAEMSLAQSRYEHSANRNREPSPMYQVGDEVWLSTRNIKTLVKR